MSCFRRFRRCFRKKPKFTHPGDLSSEPAAVRIEEDPDYDTPDKRSRFFAVLLPDKDENKEESLTMNLTIDKGAKATEQEDGGVFEEKANNALMDYRAILSRRMAVYEDTYKNPVAKPVEVGVVFQVPRSKIIINPFDFEVDSKVKGKTYVASKVKVVEKRVKALDTDKPVKNILYELFQPVNESRLSWKTKRSV